MNVVCILFCHKNLYLMCYYSPLIKVFETTVCKLRLHLRIIMAERRCCLMMITRSKPRAKQSINNMCPITALVVLQNQRKKENILYIFLSEHLFISLCQKLSWVVHAWSQTPWLSNLPLSCYITLLFHQVLGGPTVSPISGHSLIHINYLALQHERLESHFLFQSLRKL